MSGGTGEWEAYKGEGGRGGGNNKIETKMSTIGSKVEHAGEYVSDKAAQGKHASKQMEAKGERKINQEIAKDSTNTAGERIKAAGAAVKEGVKEVAEGGIKKVHETKAEHHKNKVTGQY